MCRTPLLWPLSVSLHFEVHRTCPDVRVVSVWSVCSLPRRRVLHRVKGKVWNYLLSKQEKEWDDKYL